MQIEQDYIELRVSYPGAVVSAIGLGCLTGNFKKAKNSFLYRYDRLDDGTEQHVHCLPTCDLTYEIEEVIDGKLTRWYCATLDGDPTIHRINQYGAKLYARREMPLRQVIEEYPEIQPLDNTLEEDD